MSKFCCTCGIVPETLNTAECYIDYKSKELVTTKVCTDCYEMIFNSQFQDRTKISVQENYRVAYSKDSIGNIKVPEGISFPLDYGKYGKKEFVNSPKNLSIIALIDSFSKLFSENSFMSNASMHRDFNTGDFSSDIYETIDHVWIDEKTSFCHSITLDYQKLSSEAGALYRHLVNRDYNYVVNICHDDSAEDATEYMQVFVELN